jgi:hypothetical protein
VAAELLYGDSGWLKRNPVEFGICRETLVAKMADTLSEYYIKGGV